MVDTPRHKAGEMTLSGNVSWGMSLTNLACNCELDFRFTSRRKKLSTGLIRWNPNPFLLFAGMICKMFLFMVLRVFTSVLQAGSFRFNMQNNRPLAN